MAVATAPSIETPARFDYGRVVKWGLIAGIGTVFVSVIGMVEAFSDRAIVDPILGLGYLALVWMPLAFGYQATDKKVLEGMEAPPKGLHNVVGGAAAGLLAGGVLAAFILLIDSVNLRDSLPNVSPRLLELLTFTRGDGEASVAFGVLAVLLGGAALGAIGGGFHLLGERLRKAVIGGAVWVVVVSMLELIIGQLLRGIDDAALVGWLLPDLEPVADWLHDPSTRGLHWVAAIVVFVTGGGITYALGGRRESFRERFAALPEETRRRSGFVAAVVLIFLGFWMPTFVGGFVNEIFATVGLFLLMGLGLNVVVGLAGLLDLGYVAFFAVGAYTTAILMSPESPRITPEWPFWIVILIVIVAAVIAGIMVGTPVIRMRGDYLAIVTLGFGEIVRIMFLSDWTKPITGGAQGIINVPSIIISRGFAVIALSLVIAGLAGYAVWWAVRNGNRLSSSDGEVRSSALWRLGAFAFAIAGVVFSLWFFAKDEGPIEILGTNTQAIVYMVLLFAILAAYISWRIQDSRVGRAWMAMREDEQVAEAMGINIVTAKLLAFITGAILASFGGALFAVKIGSIFPNSFALLVSIIVLVLIIVGGMGNIPGVAVGAFMLVGILGGPTQPGLLREFEDYKLLIYGALLVWMMLKRPEGLLPSIRRSRELHQEEFLQDAWLRKQLDQEDEAAEGVD